MGKKRRMIAHPQKFGKKFAAHPATRNISEDVAETKTTETVVETAVIKEKTAETILESVKKTAVETPTPTVSETTTTAKKTNRPAKKKSATKKKSSWSRKKQK